MNSTGAGKIFPLAASSAARLCQRVISFRGYAGQPVGAFTFGGYAVTNETAGAGENALVDLQALTNLYGADVVAELLASSLQESRQLLRLLASGIEQKDRQIVKDAAHTFKGMASTMTMMITSDLSEELEHCARAEDWSAAQAVYDRLVENVTAVQEIVTRAIGVA